jgi:N-acetylneuraminate synthase/sialic acid synthase
MSMTVTIGNRRIGPGEPTLVIAEIGLNHNGDPDLAAQLIRSAAAAGVDAVKFQKRDSRALLTTAAYEAPYESPQAYGATYGAHREALELSVEELARLRDLAEDLDLLFFASAWDLPSIDVCEDLQAPVYKIASADVSNLPLLERTASTGRPIILSTGMSEEWEVAAAVETIRTHHDRLVLLHCVSTYPAGFDEVNLRQIGWLRERFNCPVGYSGHERGIAISAAAVALGANVIERHFTLDRTMKGPDHAASLEPTGLIRLVRDIRAIEVAMGSTERKVSERELLVRRKLAKSLVAARDLPAGHVLGTSDLVAKSPGTGVPPNRAADLVGHRLARPVPADQILHLDDLTT